LKILKNSLYKIDNKYLKVQKTKDSNLFEERDFEISSEIDKKTPEEIFHQSYLIIRKKLMEELLTNLKNCNPRFFENLVVELLVSLGYGGSFSEAGLAIGRSGDEGIDGIIKEDILGLDVLYIQAKKWEGTIGRPEIQKFAGALHGQRSKKGIFIATGTFSTEAKEYVSKIESKIVLIDGKQLTEYMIDNNIGVIPGKTYNIKKIDTDYFEDNQ